MGDWEPLDGYKFWNKLVALFVLPMLDCQGLDPWQWSGYEGASIIFQNLFHEGSYSLGQKVRVCNFCGSVKRPLTFCQCDLEKQMFVIILAHCTKCIKNTWGRFPSRAFFAMIPMTAVMEKDIMKRIPKVDECRVFGFKHNGQNGGPKP